MVADIVSGLGWLSRKLDLASENHFGESRDFMVAATREQRTGLQFLGIASRCLLTAATVAIFGGCSSSSVMRAYPSHINPLIQQVRTGTPVAVPTVLAPQTRGNDRILYLMERGRIAQVQGSYNSSIEDFRAAIEFIKENDRKARLSVTSGGAQVAAVALNDNAIPYRGNGYERVFLHSFQALNYLANNDLEGAGVEVRIANAEQETALKEHAREVHKALTTAAANNISRTIDEPSLTTRFASMDTVAGKVKNSFQNAYTFYMSGLIWELAGEDNDAYIDYKRALEIFPHNKYLQRDVLRLAQSLGMTDELERFQAAFSKSLMTEPRVSQPETPMGAKTGLPAEEFAFWLAALREPYEAKNSAALGSAISAFRRMYKDRADVAAIEKQLVSALRESIPATSETNKTGLQENEFRFWIAALRQPYEARDHAGLASTISQFRAKHSNRPDVADIEKKLVDEVRRQVAMSSASGNTIASSSDQISDLQFACWYDRFRIPYDQRDSAALSAAIGEFRETFARYPDVKEVEERLVAKLKKSKSKSLRDCKSMPASEGELVVLYEDEFVPQKQEVKIPVPLPSLNTVVAIAFPIYQVGGDDVVPLSVAEGAVSLGATEPICDVSALAVKSLKEQIPEIVTRQVIRTTSKAIAANAVNSATRAATAKRATQNNAGAEFAGMLIQLGMTIYNVATENADLRSWTTLPRNAQIMRIRLKPGSRTLRITRGDGTVAADVNVDVRPGGKTIVHVVRAGSRLYSNTMTF